MSSIRTVRAFSALSSLLLFAACGGGGGGGTDPSSGFNPPPLPPAPQQPPPSSTQPPASQPPESSPPPIMPSGTVSFETTAVTFATSARNATPPVQEIAITLTGVPDGARNSRAQIDGEAVLFADVEITNGTGRLRITPEDANRLAVGVNTATITVSICIDDPGCSIGLRVGQPQTINVTYTVTPSVQGDVVAPRVLTANQPGDVVIRGRGFTGATSVRFGTVAASGLTVVSDSEIRASYPALAPARYPIAINSGTIAFTGAVTAVNVPNYAAATLAFPSTPTEIGALLYDPERNALLVAARYEQRDADQLIRFTYSAGQWSTPLAVNVPGIRDLAFSPDGSSLLVLTDQRLVEYDPSTLTAGASDAPSDETLDRARSIGFNGLESTFFRSLAVANDGYALVSTGIVANGLAPLYVYSTRDHTFTVLDRVNQQNNGVIGASASGSFVALVPSISGLSALTAPLYGASEQRLLGFAQVRIGDDPYLIRSAKPALDRAGSLSVLNATFNLRGLNNMFSSTTVYDNQTKQRRGRLPVNSSATVVKPDATRVYALQLSSPRESMELRTYDLTQPLANADAEYAQVGTALPLSLQSGDGAFAMIATPDGSTLFVAGVSGVIVQPTPP